MTPPDVPSAAPFRSREKWIDCARRTQGILPKAISICPSCKKMQIQEFARMRRQKQDVLHGATQTLAPKEQGQPGPSQHAPPKTPTLRATATKYSEKI